LSQHQLQKISLRRTEPLPSTCLETHLLIPTKYREQGGQVLCKLFDLDDEAMIGWDWQADRYKPTTSSLQGGWIRPIAHQQHQQQQQQQQQQQRTLLYLHGGHYFLGTYKLYRGLLGDLASLADARVLAVDYRLAPDHPFPTAVEDALAAYLYMLDPPEDAPFTPIPSSQIVLSGDSAGNIVTYPHPL
jgi:acetyl esterase/lipase